MENVFGQTLVGKDGNIPTSSLQNVEFVLVYFSAHWCPPCRGFTPKLAHFYNTVNSSNKCLEIVFVSFDRTESDFRGYYDTMPWVAVPFNQQAIKERLATEHGVSGIPALILIDRQGKCVSAEGRAGVEGDGPAVLDKWRRALQS